jgi:hypothetical protein
MRMDSVGHQLCCVFAGVCAYIIKNGSGYSRNFVATPNCDK